MTRKRQHGKRQRRRTGRGFTLVEVIVGGSLTLLLFLGAVDLYVASAQVAVRSGAACYATTDAANAVQHIGRDVGEAHWLALPEDAWWASPGGQAPGAFQTTAGGSRVDTGVELVSPASGSLSVAGGNGSLITPPVYDRSATSSPPSILWIYRANGDGTPNAASGGYLWLSGTELGQPVSRALLASLSPASAGAVQFQRPADSSGAQQFPYQLEVRLVSAYYSSVRGAQTSELTTGNQQAPVIGKCVLSRDHELNLDHEPNPTPAYGAANMPLRSD